MEYAFLSLQIPFFLESLELFLCPFTFCFRPFLQSLLHPLLSSLPSPPMITIVALKRCWSVNTLWTDPWVWGGTAHLCGRPQPHRRHWARHSKHQPIQTDTGTGTVLFPECKYLCFYMETDCRGSPGSETGAYTYINIQTPETKKKLHCVLRNQTN